MTPLFTCLSKTPGPSLFFDPVLVLTNERSVYCNSLYKIFIVWCLLLLQLPEVAGIISWAGYPEFQVPVLDHPSLSSPFGRFQVSCGSSLRASCSQDA